ncbi:MAG: sensor histidine kinase [Actinomycetes bacterium]
MWDQRVRPLPGLLLALTVAVEAGAVPLAWDLESRYDTVLYAVSAVALAGAGALIASRHPENAVGWLFCWFALFNAVTADLAEAWGLRAAEQGWPAGPAAECVSNASWLPSGLGWILTFLLFPDGRLPDRRWRVVLWAGVVGCALALPGYALSPSRDSDFVHGHNPIAVTSPILPVLLLVGAVLFLSALVAAAASLVVRFRRSSGVERQQLKWFTLAAAFAGIALPTSLVLWDVWEPVRVLAAIALTLLPLAACAAILRYRLYDIDVVIDRTIVYAILSVLLAATYAMATIVLGAKLGRGSPVVTAAATLVVALVFHPLRAQVQDAADRRFRRARYDARHRFAEFYESLRRGTSSPEAVEGILRDVLGDPGLLVLFRLPGENGYVDSRGQSVDPALIDTGRQLPITRGDRSLGVVQHGAGGPADPALARLAVDACGLATEMTRLRVDLRRQLAKVEASRGRILEAGNEERRRLERDLHDGAQQRLVSIGLALRHAQHELRTGKADRAGSVIDEAVTDVAATIDELRQLAHGFPPAQLDAGIGPAFRELARRSPLPVQVDASSERYDAGLEAAAYFVGCEGLTNAVKHARATHVDLGVARRNGSLLVTVGDDGIGGATVDAGSGLRGLADRVAAVGGALRIESPPGSGTLLVAELPCES